MKHIHFDVESDGFYGAYWACKDGSDCAVIAMLGDDPEDYMVCLLLCGFQFAQVIVHYRAERLQGASLLLAGIVRSALR